MRRYVRDLRPTSVYDLAAMVALYRPGPMDNIPAYIRRKHGQEPVTYLHPLLEPYLEKTYGIFVYQEDIMSAAIALGGFTGPEADTLGYAIRKKKSAVLRAQKEQFVTQAAERGVAPDVIDAVFKAFEPFERYGFNKAHATCYGLIAYQTAYMKANYTVEYMTAVLTAFRSNEEKVAAAVAECRRMGIEVLPPDVHSSHLEFTVEGDAIRFGLLAVKNVGQGAIESIIAARDEGGPFRSLTDFCTRIDLRLANRKVLEALAKVGALSPFGHPAQILLGLDDAVAAARRPSATGSRARRRCSTSAPPTRPPSSGRCRPPPRCPSASGCAGRRSCSACTSRSIRWARSPSGSAQFVTAYSSDLRDESLDGQRVVVGGIVTGARTVITKAKATMAIVTMEDLQGTIEVVVFPRLYEQTGRTWREGEILLVAGRVDHKGEDVSLLADLAVDWDAASAAGRGRVRAAGRGGRARRRPPRTGRERRQRERHGRRRRARGRPVRRDRRSPRPARCRRRPGRARRRRRRLAAAPAVPYVSPRRAVAADRGAVRRDLPAIAPAEPVSTYADLPGGVPPARRRRRAVRARRGPRTDRRRRHRGRARSTPGPSTVLHVRFAGSAADRPRRRRDGDVQVRDARPARARPGSSSTSRRRAAARPCRWSSGAASPTTPSCWPRSGAGWATGWWSPPAPRLTRQRQASPRDPADRPGPPTAARGTRRGSR